MQPSSLACVGVALFLGGVATAACAEPPPQMEEGMQRFARPSTGSTQRAVTLPSSAAATKLRHILDVMNGAPLGDATEHFTPDFLEYIKAEEIASELASVGQAFEGESVIPIEFDALEDRPDTINATVSSRRGKMFLTIFLLLNEETNRISALRIDPAGREPQAGGGGGGGPADWGEFGGELADLPGEISFGTWALVPSPAGTQELVAVAAQNENTTLAIGSSFKLWVLGAVAEEVLKTAETKPAESTTAENKTAESKPAAGEAEALSWNSLLTVRDELKSLPSGTLQLRDAGTTISVLEAATQMISISDNTATDHLMQLVGRERVEAFMKSVNSTPERNMPMLTTREAFVLKLSSDDGLLERFLAGDEAGKRDLLRDVIREQKPDVEAAGEWAEPRLIDEVEWFASAYDCARTLARLRELELLGISNAAAANEKPDTMADEQAPATPEARLLAATNPLGSILRKNAGLSLDPKIWKSAAFKGGSEPGVLHGCWLLERSDGKWFVFSLGWNDKEELIDQDRFLQLAQQGVALLAKDGVEKGEKLPENEAGEDVPERVPVKPAEGETPLRGT